MNSSIRDRFARPRQVVDSSTLDPTWWWRQLCWVTDRIIVTGDLADDDETAADQIRLWADVGVGLIVDVRSECNDRRRVAEIHPEIEYLHAPTHDHGGTQPDEWFDETVERIISVLESDPLTVVLIHCHMGVNRAPSMAMAVLMALGSTAVDALDSIRSARPIAAVLYSDQVVDWFQRRLGASDEERFAAIESVRRWHETNPIETGWIISRINRRISADLMADLNGDHRWRVGGDHDGDARLDDDGVAD